MLALSLAGEAADDRVTLEEALPSFPGLPGPAGATVSTLAMWIAEHLCGLRRHPADTIAPALGTVCAAPPAVVALTGRRRALD
jgi:hypothetical protein